MLAFDSYLVQLIEKLSVKTPSGEVKLKVLKEIAKEYQVQWDTTETEEELLKPPEERIVCTPPLSPRTHTSRDAQHEFDMYIVLYCFLAGRSEQFC